MVSDYNFLLFYFSLILCNLVGKESACNAGDSGSISESGRSPGEGNGNPLRYSCLENSMDSGIWQATVHGVTKNQKRLSNKYIYNMSLDDFLLHLLEKMRRVMVIKDLGSLLLP